MVGPLGDTEEGGFGGCWRVCGEKDLLLLKRILEGGHGGAGKTSGWGGEHK